MQNCEYRHLTNNPALTFEVLKRKVREEVMFMVDPDIQTARVKVTRWGLGEGHNVRVGVSLNGHG